MRNMHNLIVGLLCGLLLFTYSHQGNAQNFSNNKIVATINGENLYESALNKLLIRSYGKDEAEALRTPVIRFHLYEMIIFKIMEQKLRKIKVKCYKRDYLEDVDRYEKPFFTYYVRWGLKNSNHLAHKLQEIVKYSFHLKKKYEKWFQSLSNRLIQKNDIQKLLKIWQESVSDRRTHRKLRKLVFKKYHLDARDFKRRIKLITKFRKYVSSQLSQQEITQFAQKEKFALSDGLIRMQHLFLMTRNPETGKKLSLQQQERIKKLIIKIRGFIRPDLANFSKMVQRYSEDRSSKYQSGSLGWIPRWTAATLFGGFLSHIGWVPHSIISMPAIVDRGYHLPIKQLSQPIKSRWGYHLIVVTQRKPAKVLTKEELHKRALNMLAMMRMEKMLRKWIKQGKIQQNL